METQTDSLEVTSVEPISCPLCGARFTYQDLVYGHTHVAKPVSKVVQS